MTPTDLGTILSIWAHPDDETYLAGATMAAAVEAGQRVVCVSATAGEHGTDDPVRWPPERLGRVRRAEAAAAMAALGVTDHRWMDEPDGGLAGLDPTGPVRRISALIEEVGPDTILTFGPDGITFHPDHQAVSNWVTTAWRTAGCPGRLLHAAVSTEHLERWDEQYRRWDVSMTDDRPRGVDPGHLALRVQPTGALLDRKLVALRAMHTQVTDALATLGSDDFEAMAAEECFVAVPR